MKLKYKFIVRNVAGNPVAVAVGLDNERFNGMIKLNPSGEVIFQMLNEEDISLDAITARFAARFGIAEETAKPAVLDFLNYLRQNEMLEE